MTIGEWIRAEREARGWSQDDLAFEARVSVRLIGRYERAEGEPNMTNLEKIAGAFRRGLPWTKAKGRLLAFELLEPVPLAV